MVLQKQKYLPDEEGGRTVRVFLQLLSMDEAFYWAAWHTLT